MLFGIAGFTSGNAKKVFSSEGCLIAEWKICENLVNVAQ